MTGRLRRPGSTILLAAWGLAAALILFATENIWVDDLVRSRWHGLPSLVPTEGSTGWVAAFGLMGISCAVLLVCQVFVLRDRSLAAVKKWSTVCVSVFALVLFGLWFWETGIGSSSASPQKQHTVTLTWTASTSRVDGYNVYRSESPGGPFVKINDALVRECSSVKINDKTVQRCTFIDRHVTSGVKYYYTAKAVAGKQVSEDSNHVEADVPVP
jgi:hypothetical protein